VRSGAVNSQTENSERACGGADESAGFGSSIETPDIERSIQYNPEHEQQKQLASEG